MIDYEGLPAPKEYYDDIGTVITPETWFKISGIEYTPARMPRRTPPLWRRPPKKHFALNARMREKTICNGLKKGPGSGWLGRVARLQQRKP